MKDAPTMEETVAVLAAVETYQRKMRPRQKRVVRDLPKFLAELAESVRKVQAVTHE